MNAKELLTDIDYSTDCDISSLDISGITPDSSAVKEGFVFVCHSGMRRSGDEYIPEAEARGAAAILLSRDSGAHCKLPAIRVSDTRAAEAFMQNRFCGDPAHKMKFAAVTGTNGKSSTAFMLYNIMLAAGRKTALIGTIRNLFCGAPVPLSDGDEAKMSTMTTPDPAQLYPLLARFCALGTEYVIMEASSHALYLSKLAPIDFELAAFTNLSPEHLDFHGDMDSYFAAKMKLFSQTKRGVFNIDDSYATLAANASPCDIITVSAKRDADYYADGITLLGVDGVSFRLHGKDSLIKLHSPIPGEFTVYNAMTAAVCASELGARPSAIQDAISGTAGIDGRFEKVYSDTDAGFTVFIDYAHTAEAMRNLLASAAAIKPGGGRIVTLFGCGGERDKSKRAPMGKTACDNSDFVIITSDNSRSEEPREIIGDILKGVADKNNYIVIENRREAIKFAISRATRGDIILLVGKGHENYEIDKNGKHKFNEREEVLCAVRDRQKKK